MKHIIYVSLLLTAFYTWAFHGIMSHIPYYLEQHHLFLYSWEYLFHTIHNEGIINYLSYFIIQFFYYPIIAVCYYAILLSAIYTLSSWNVYKLIGRSDSLHLGLIPSFYCFLQCLDMENTIPTLLAWFITLLYIRIIIAMPWKKWKFILILPLFSFIPWHIIATIAALFILSTLAAYYLSKISNRKIQTIISCLAISIYGLTTLHLFNNTFDMNVRRLMQVQELMEKKDWNNVISLSEACIRKERNTQLMYYFRNIALYHTGKLAEKLFDIPQKLGESSLYLPLKAEGMVEYAAILYDELEHWNAAHRIVFEKMTTWGETAPIISNLVKYNVKMGRYRVARKFANVLNLSLFHKNNYDIPSGKDTGDSACMHFFDFKQVIPEIEYLYNSGSHSPIVREYLLCALLLQNRVYDFASVLASQNINYPLPHSYEEALCIYQAKHPEEFEKLNLHIDTATLNRFYDYMNLKKQNDFNTVKSRYGRSYWYYIEFISPYGNKIMKTVNNENK